MTRNQARSITTLLALMCLCGCAGSMRAQYAEHLTTVIKPGQPDTQAAGEKPYAPTTALTAVPDH